VVVDHTISVSFGKVGINDVKQLSSFTIYPNPVRETLTLVRSTTDNKARIEVYNGNGILVQLLPATDTMTKVNVSSLPAGIYVIKLIENQNVAIQKFVVE